MVCSITVVRKTVNASLSRNLIFYSALAILCCCQHQIFRFYFELRRGCSRQIQSLIITQVEIDDCLRCRVPFLI